MAALPAAERERSPDGGDSRALRGESNRAILTPASATALPVPSEGGGRTVVFDHRQSTLAPPPRRSRLRWFSFIIIVAIPAAIAATYYFLVAADQYVAEFRFALRSAESSAMTQPYFFRRALHLR